MTLWNDLSQRDRDRRKNLQVVLEEDLMGVGVTKYWDEVNRCPDEAAPEQQLLDASIIHLQPLFQEWIDYAVNERKTPKWLPPLLSIGSYKMADLVIRNVIKTTLEGCTEHGLQWGKNARAQTLSSDIADDVINIVSYQVTKDNFKEDWRRQSKFTKNWSPKRCKAFTKKMNKLTTMSRKNKQDFGHAMLRIGLLSNILIKETEKSLNNKRLRKSMYVRLSDEILESLAKRHHLLELSNLIYRPMIAPPVDHLMDEPGGPYLRWLRKPTVKRYVNDTNKNETITQHCSELVLDGLNGMQKTEWCINTKVKDVMQALFTNNTCCGGLPHYEFEGFQMGEYPKDGSKQDQSVWMRQKEELWGGWYKDEQKRSRMLVRLHIADSLILRGFFFHAYSLDFRGRGYTSCELLSPQGSDFDKSLIHFANAIEQTERGWYWLKVHTANLFDQDHLSFDDRVQWVDDNRPMLQAIADNPYDNREWMSDKVKKNPSFQRLAACFELARTDGLTQLPIQKDGKCNGSQHWGVIMGDELVSKLTNVLTSSTPQDLYAYVADETTRYIKLNPSNIEWLDKFNDHWCSGLTRDVVKRPTMCDSYGLTFYGIQKYIKLEGHLDWVDREGRGGAVVELARAIQAGLGSVLELPNQGKDWLKECAKKAGEKDKHMIWTTPSGFIVEHVYQPIRQRRSYVELYNQKKLTLSFSNFIDGVNEKGQELGIAPNFIHSLDAAHMFITIFLMLRAGFTDFSMIHDSYGCHAPLIDEMDALLREGFIETHKGNVLEQFKSDIEDYCEVTVPTPPVRQGTVTARCVKESEYFFA